MATWIKVDDYDYLNLDQGVRIRYNPARNEILIITADGGSSIVISRKKDPTPFQQIADYIKQTTGHDLT